MIKASGAVGDEPLLILGLSEENLRRLPHDRPIRIHAAELVAMGLPALQIVIMGGKTEDSIVAQLREVFPGMRQEGP